MSEIKQCPFCGNDSPTVRIYEGKNGWRNRYAVLCRYDEGGCGAESGLYHSREEAVEAWNTREKAEAPEPMIYGYNLQELFVLADACKRQNVKPDDLNRFVMDSGTGFNYGYQEYQRQMQESMEKIIRDMNEQLD